ncbi:hypothetical protein FOH10_25640 [Nocardia otitidiscaviarum]|uniref:Uncharacterized protein n=1 Tax=Nocardia otitidiscaviarum TaxID=1823 RepID=A0A516NRU2_9NOCA|nr:hypothetical protein FOH10_25640 [Nocardia otitidiscaviarum]
MQLDAGLAQGAIQDRDLVEAGYALVQVDIRGIGVSEGDWQLCGPQGAFESVAVGRSGAVLDEQDAGVDGVSDRNPLVGMAVKCFLGHSRRSILGAEGSAPFVTVEDPVDRVEHVRHRQELGAFDGIPVDVHSAVVMFEQCPDVGVQRETLASFQLRDLFGGGAGLQSRDGGG